MNYEKMWKTLKECFRRLMFEEFNTIKIILKLMEQIEEENKE